MRRKVMHWQPHLQCACPVSMWTRSTGFSKRCEAMCGGAYILHDEGEGRVEAHGLGAPGGGDGAGPIRVVQVGVEQPNLPRRLDQQEECPVRGVQARALNAGIGHLV